ncbi:sensor histidine kinase [Ottowia sp.]|uniref:sensor histidine kinase n=1 Tax=Ottowia sp. TaxID=1898956 RepID=UPI002D1B7477|nr:sensor histidine kinase [Ottowia sp.]HRN76894.1 sensor histidine kinase [Ottowia sp.]HRQ03652.1 sensor histidine kinase [Ottowia sp.]
MLSADLVILAAIAYVGLLFALAFVSDARARKGDGALLRSPLVYTLSISVYCTSWTFYGAVGTAARVGLEFLAIYLGPTLVFIGWWFVLRKLVRIGRVQRITSIADLLSSRYGKSSPLAVLVTLIAIVAVTPYIALQLKAITTSIQVVSAAAPSSGGPLRDLHEIQLAFGVAAMMALFTILFGTRNVDAKEQHHGVVAAIAFEAIVKLLALLAVGAFVVFGVSGGLDQIYLRAEQAGIDVFAQQQFGSRWIALLVLSATAVLCLPRQFQITVVENANENHLRTASWAFPGYLLLASLFTLPIALYGLTELPGGSNPDMFVLTIPMASGQTGLALFAFIGGFSSATSMIIVASIALSIMISNHILLPLALRQSRTIDLSGDQGIARLLLKTRRLSIAGILLLGFLYFWMTTGSDALAPIGLISFAGVAQFLPAMLAALYWREATAKGALAGILGGFLIWAWTMFLPSFESASPGVAKLLQTGPWGIAYLQPQALFGLTGLDPLVHSVFWSLFVNTALLTVVSLATRQSVRERIQSTQFVDVFRHPAGLESTLIGRSATTSDLFFIAERVLGWERARELFAAATESERFTVGQSEVLPGFIGQLERELAGSIGAASAHILLSKVVSGTDMSLEEFMTIADEAQQVIEYSHELERTSEALRQTAQQLQHANTLLQELHQQKDDFLSQISHEVRTPMTAIRSFSEILLDDKDLTPAQHDRFTSIIQEESKRLTLLLDEILDISALEHGESDWDNRPTDPDEAIEHALEVCEGLAHQRGIQVRVGTRVAGARINADVNRLCQVLINILSNAVKYNNAADPVIQVDSSIAGDRYRIEVADNGPGIPPEIRASLFHKFVRGRHDPSAPSISSGRGLGLNISQTIVTKMGGELELVDGPLAGACFRLSFPLLTSQGSPDAHS